jgi:hypothetical protein
MWVLRFTRRRKCKLSSSVLWRSEVPLVVTDVSAERIASMYLENKGSNETVDTEKQGCTAPKPVRSQYTLIVAVSANKCFLSKQLWPQHNKQLFQGSTETTKELNNRLVLGTRTPSCRHLLVEEAVEINWRIIAFSSSTLYPFFLSIICVIPLCPWQALLKPT